MFAVKRLTQGTLGWNGPFQQKTDTCPKEGATLPDTLFSWPGPESAKPRECIATFFGLLYIYIYVCVCMYTYLQYICSYLCTVFIYLFLIVLPFKLFSLPSFPPCFLLPFLYSILCLSVPSFLSSFLPCFLPSFLPSFLPFYLPSFIHPSFIHYLCNFINSFLSLSTK